MTEPPPLPPDLPVPVDDGAADHLAGMRVAPVTLPATDGARVAVGSAGGRAVLFCFPHIADPQAGPPAPGWDRIPGARGCTPEACGFRDLHREFADRGTGVFGVSTDGLEHQREAAARLGLPYPLLSDARLRLAHAWRLPRFEAGGRVLLRRLTMLIAAGRIEQVWYPVFPPDRHAGEVLAALRPR